MAFFLSYICRSCLRSQRVYQSPLRKALKNVSARKLHVHSSPRRFRLGIIGSGPAGFYTAATVMKDLGDAVSIDMYDKLPVPYGLTRYGVAPDHPEVRNCQERFEEVAESSTFSFIGNVNIGHDIPLSLLRTHYDALLFTYGSSRDNVLGLPTPSNVYPASRLVEWYTGHPDIPLQYREEFSDWTGVEDVVIVGNGNVALDVARMLLLPPSKLTQGGDMAQKSDMPSSVMHALSTSRVKNVHIVGRRGAPQAKFTTKELRELLTMENVTWRTGTAHTDYTPVSKTDLKSLDRPRRRVLELLNKNHSLTPAIKGGEAKNVFLHFLASPHSFTETHAVFAPTTYPPGSDPLSATARTVLAELPLLEIPTQRTFLAIGYVGVPLPGLEDLGIAFDERRGIIPNDRGRIINEKNEVPIEGCYVAGWLKRGAEGVIAATWVDAVETGEVIVQDLSTLAQSPDKVEYKGGVDALRPLLKERAVRTVSWDDWKKIDKEELRRGKEEGRGKEREKILEREEILRVFD